jgi:hypothetical protein
VKTDFWRAANVGLCVLDLFVRINRNERALTLADDFEARFGPLAAEHGRLRDEMMATERFKKAQGTIPEAELATD